MKLNNQDAEVFIPDGKDLSEAFERTTHMAIAAHQDDIEIMAYDGVLKCFGEADKWFFGVVSTDGAGSPRDSIYANYTDEQMREVRRIEQKKAASIGEYSAVALLDYPSSEVKEPEGPDFIDDLKAIISNARPDTIYVHNPADKHDTHVAVAIRTIKAIRELPPEFKPSRLYGCEVWRALDWVNDQEKVIFDVADHPNLSASLLGVYDSQICGGARYDLAAVGRRRANATFAESHDTDATDAAIYAVDLTPLIDDPEMAIDSFIVGFIDRFKKDVLSNINKLC